MPYSRASLECRAPVAPKLDDVRYRLETTFRKHGLPLYMLSDTGPPFGSIGLGRFSRLGVWLLRLGVQPVFIEPCRPDQDGRHERLHETLKVETATPLRPSIRAQQAAFTLFQRVYNEQRPHETIGMRVPAQLHARSQRRLPLVLREHECPQDFAVRRVRRDGSIKWKCGYLFVGTAMVGELVGLQIVDDERWHVFLGPMRLGVVHDRSRTVLPLAIDGD